MTADNKPPEANPKQKAPKVEIPVPRRLTIMDALEKLATDDLAEIVVTDTVPLDPLERPDNLTVLPVSGLLADTIMNVFADESVSAVFQGANQLF